MLYSMCKFFKTSKSTYRKRFCIFLFRDGSDKPLKTSQREVSCVGRHRASNDKCSGGSVLIGIEWIARSFELTTDKHAQFDVTSLHSPPDLE